MCCVIGSVLFIAVAWCTRTFKVKVLGQQPAAPERWRLPVGDGAAQGHGDAVAAGVGHIDPANTGAILEERGRGLVVAR